MNAPSITVKDVWRGALPEGTQLLGGGRGLERRVEWACALRSRPPAFDAVKGGEMAFVPVRSIRMLDERLDLPQVMTSFAEKGGVAVAALGDVSAASITVADQRALPLLQLPESAHVADVHQACVRFILDQRTVLHERVQELQLALMELALAGSGAPAIVERLAELTSLTAAWHDGTGAVRHLTGGEGELFLGEQLAEDAESLRRWGDTVTITAADPPVREFSLPFQGWARLVSPIAGRHGVAGFVSVIGHETQLTHVASVGASRAAAACAIEVDRERAVSETRERLEGEVLDSLLAGTYASERAVVERSQRVGLNLDGSVAVIALRSGGRGTLSWEAAALQAARAAVQHRDIDAVVCAHDGAACVVVSTQEESDVAVRRLALVVQEASAAGTGDPSTMAGVGRIKRGAAGVRASYREAEHALGLGRRLKGSVSMVTFADLGLHRLLLTMTAHSELRDFYDDVIGSLAAYDRRARAGLLETLDAYFACNGSPTDAAQRLHLHRNTVLYRLRRIEQVGRVRLGDAGTRLNLHLCLRIRDVLDSEAATSQA